VAKQLKLINLKRTQSELDDVEFMNHFIEVIQGKIFTESSFLKALVKCGEAKNKREAESIYKELASYGFITRKINYTPGGFGFNDQRDFNNDITFREEFNDFDISSRIIYDSNQSTDEVKIYFIYFIYLFNFEFFLFFLH
jgi:hypothetical protein